MIHKNKEFGYLFGSGSAGLGFIEKNVTPFGTGAKVDCPKEYLGKRVILVILRD